MGRWSNSWHLLKETWNILKLDKEMLWFPVFSLIFTGMVFLSFLLPLVLSKAFAPSPIYFLFLFLFYFISYFIIIFFNTGLVICASIRLSGGDPTVRDGLIGASNHLGKILGWTAVAATVGFILRVIIDKLNERSQFLGAILVSLLGMAWTLLTFFVVPVMIFENKGVFAAIKESGSLFKKTWGENVVGQFSMGLVFFVLGILGVIPLVLTFLSGSLPAILIVFAGVLFYWIILSIFSSTLNGIFITALYYYARTGRVPAGYEKEHIKGAFKKRETGFPFSGMGINSR